MEIRINKQRIFAKQPIVAALIALGVSGPALAGDVTLPNAFAAGQPAVAAEVNANFDAVKTAVDDNNARVTANATENAAHKTRLDNAETQLTSHTNSITSINNGMVRNRGDISRHEVRLDRLESSAYVSVDSAAFDSENVSELQSNTCIFNKNYGAGSAYFINHSGAASSSCDAVAGLQLPHGKTLRSLSCYVRDNTMNTSLNAYLYRTALVNGFSQRIFVTNRSSDGPSIQRIFDTSAAGTTAVVDNSQYSYRLALDYSSNDFRAIGSNAIIYGCRVLYQ